MSLTYNVDDRTAWHRLAHATDDGGDTSFGMQTARKLIHIGRPIEMDDEKFKAQLDRLDAAYRAESDNMKELVAEIVPTYHPQTAVK